MVKEIDIEELKQIAKDCKKSLVIVFINCKIENITITGSDVDFREGEHNHYYNPTG